jgi:hypothetical protein
MSFPLLTTRFGHIRSPPPVLEHLAFYAAAVPFVRICDGEVLINQAAGDFRVQARRQCCYSAFPLSSTLLLLSFQSCSILVLNGSLCNDSRVSIYSVAEKLPANLR